MSGVADAVHLRELHREWIDQAIADDRHGRDGKWSSAVAVGHAGYVDGIKEKLGHEGVGRKVAEVGGDEYVLREPETAYMHNFTSKLAALSSDNTVFYDVNALESEC